MQIRCLSEGAACSIAIDRERRAECAACITGVGSVAARLILVLVLVRVCATSRPRSFRSLTASTAAASTSETSRKDWHPATIVTAR